MTVTLIEDAETLAELCPRIAAADRVALDTEFHTERTYAAKLMVVQLVVGDAVYIVDPLKIADLRPLATKICATTVVGHALQSDLKIFADRYDLLPVAAFDTQLAAAFLGYGLSISLADLVADIAGVHLRKSQTVSDWSSRPLSARQIDYLVDDVAHLFALHDRLRARLVESGRLSWFEEEGRELVDPQRYRPVPERLYFRIPGAMRMSRRELGILRELAQLRDLLARERDIPPKYIFPDDVLAGLVHVHPKRVEELAQLRRLDGGARNAFGTRIVAAVARGLALPDNELPEKPKRSPGGEREAIVAALSVLVNALASEHDLPASLLAPRSALERVARESPTTTEAMAATLDAGPWRSRLLSDPLRALLAGEIALQIVDADTGSPRITRVELAALGGASPRAKEST